MKNTKILGYLTLSLALFTGICFIISTHFDIDRNQHLQDIKEYGSIIASDMHHSSQNIYKIFSNLLLLGGFLGLISFIGWIVALVVTAKDK